MSMAFPCHECSEHVSKSFDPEGKTWLCESCVTPKARVPVKIVLAPFPGSIEAHYMGEMLPACDVGGCEAQVLFRDEENNALVCYLHGQLVLRRQWGVQERSDVEIWGEVL